MAGAVSAAVGDFDHAWRQLETGLIPLAWNDFLGDPLIYAFTILQIEFTFSFAGQRVRRAWRVYEWLLPTPLLLLAVMLIGTVSGNPYALVEAAIILPAALLLPVLLLIWYRRGNREAGWLILPSLLPGGNGRAVRCGVRCHLRGMGSSDVPGRSDPGGAGCAVVVGRGGFSVRARHRGGDVLPVHTGEPGAGAERRQSWRPRGRSSGGWCRHVVPQVAGYTLSRLRTIRRRRWEGISIRCWSPEAARRWWWLAT
jgi:hypothetical protein